MSTTRITQDYCQHNFCATPPGCSCHLAERNAELAQRVGQLEVENEALHLLVQRQAAALARPESKRLAAAEAAMAGRVLMFEALDDRIAWLLRELDEWMSRAGDAERRLELVRHAQKRIADELDEALRGGLK